MAFQLAGVGGFPGTAPDHVSKWTSDQPKVKSLNKPLLGPHEVYQVLKSSALISDLLLLNLGQSAQI